jgi:hypothetical protein
MGSNQSYAELCSLMSSLEHPRQMLPTEVSFPMKKSLPKFPKRKAYWEILSTSGGLPTDIASHVPSVQEEISILCYRTTGLKRWKMYRKWI